MKTSLHVCDAAHSLECESLYCNRKKIFLCFVEISATWLYTEAMKTPGVSKTRSEQVYAQLRADLLHGEFEPGAKLRITDLSARYGCSPSVLREALNRLSQQALVLAIPQRGFAVPELTMDGLLDLRHARILVETMALRESITHGDLQWESDVLAAHHRLQQTHQVDGGGHLTEEWDRVHNHFHYTLLAGGPSKVLTEVAVGLRDRSQLYVHWSRELVKDEGRDVPAEHQLIAERTLARDADGAAAALQAHIERSASVLLNYVGELVE